MRGWVVQGVVRPRLQEFVERLQVSINTDYAD
jgi:hypothetical protein